LLHKIRKTRGISLVQPNFGSLKRKEDKPYLDNSGILTSIVIDHNSARRRGKSDEAVATSSPLNLSHTHTSKNRRIIWINQNLYF
jgi:hypothetical protein